MIGSRTNAAHGYLLGGNGGEGAGAGGGGGHGGGGSGIFVVDSARGNPWVVVAPGSGGGGGAGFVKDAGSRGGKADFDSGDDGDRENGVCAAGAVAGGPGQNGGGGGAAPGAGISGGGGGGGGGCNAGSGGPARGEAQGGDGGGGGNGYSPYPVTLSCNSGSTSGNDCEDSFVRVVGSFSGGPSLTTPVPDPRIAFDPIVHFVVGQARTFVLPIGFAAYGGLIPRPAGLPDGLEWVCDGDGLCTIGGAPEPGSGGVYDLDIDLIGDGEPAITLRLTVEEAPVFTQVPVPPDVRPGDVVSLDIATVGMDGRRLGLRGGLPAGLSLVDHGDGTGTISGTLDPGSEGTYPLRLVVAQDARSLSADEQRAWAYRDVVLTVSAPTDDPGTGDSDDDGDPGTGGSDDPGTGDSDDPGTGDDDGPAPDPGTDDSRDTDSQDGPAGHRDRNGTGPLADTGSNLPPAVLVMGLLALALGFVIVCRPRGRHTSRHRRPT